MIQCGVRRTSLRLFVCLSVCLFVCLSVRLNNILLPDLNKSQYFATRHLNILLPDILLPDILLPEEKVKFLASKRPVFLSGYLE